MISTFNIQPLSLATEKADLFLFINPQGIAYIIVEEGSCKALVHYRSSSTDNSASDIFSLMKEQPLLNQAFKKVAVIYGYTASVLVPHELYEDELKQPMLELMYGDATEVKVHKDFMYRHSMHNVYGLPPAVDAAVNRYFEKADCYHLFSLLPDVVKPSGSVVYCIFDNGCVLLLLQKDGQLQLVQRFNYTTPEDVVYYLLQLFSVHEIQPDSIEIKLNGMLDKASALYQELYKYFDNLHFETLPEGFQYPEELDKYPAHYFSHLFAIAQCVS